MKKNIFNSFPFCLCHSICVNAVNFFFTFENDKYLICVVWNVLEIFVKFIWSMVSLLILLCMIHHNMIMIYQSYLPLLYQEFYDYLLSLAYILRIQFPVLLNIILILLKVPQLPHTQMRLLQASHPIPSIGHFNLRVPICFSNPTIHQQH